MVSREAVNNIVNRWTLLELQRARRAPTVLARARINSRSTTPAISRFAFSAG